MSNKTDSDSVENTQLEDVYTILKFLPHRYPILLVDRIHSFIPGKKLEAIKNVSFNEPFFEGHFPGNPVMPGVLIIESLAQACGLLAFLSTGAPKNQAEKPLYFLAGIEKTRFKRVVRPGDQLKLMIEHISEKLGIFRFDCQALVDDHVVCQTVLLTARRDGL